MGVPISVLVFSSFPNTPGFSNFRSFNIDSELGNLIRRCLCLRGTRSAFTHNSGECSVDLAKEESSSENSILTYGVSFPYAELTLINFL